MSNLPSDKGVKRNQQAKVEIDGAALRHNLKLAKKYSPKAAVMAVVKANAYGHGMEVVADILDKELESEDMFAVSCLEDVGRLRRSGIKRSINTFSGQFSTHEITLVDNVIPAIFDSTQLQSLKTAHLESPLKVWLKVDTGMGRLGFFKEEVSGVLNELRSCSAVSSVGLLTHLANADDPNASSNQAQCELVHELLETNSFDAVSVLNSGGICGQQFEAPSFVPTAVRPGLMLYGASPLKDQPAEQMGLVPAMRFSAPLISVRQMPSGSKIGYGSTETLAKESTVGIVACGYGDGYPRHAKKGTPVYINGVLCPLLGRVSMDLISIDISEAQAKVGDHAVLWGAENPIEIVAQCSATIPYTLMCGISERVQRLVING